MKLRYICTAVAAVGLGATGPAAALEVLDCNVVEVATLQQRMHVRCATGRNGIIYFALGTERNAAESAFATRAMQIANAALVAGRPLLVRYEFTDTTGVAIGCLASDCRLIHTIYIR